MAPDRVCRDCAAGRKKTSVTMLDGEFGIIQHQVRSWFARGKRGRAVPGQRPTKTAVIEASIPFNGVLLPRYSGSK